LRFYPVKIQKSSHIVYNFFHRSGGFFPKERKSISSAEDHRSHRESPKNISATLGVFGGFRWEAFCRASVKIT